MSYNTTINLELCNKNLDESRARLEAQLILIKLVAPQLESYKRGSLDGWMKRHIEKVTGLHVVIGDHGHTQFWKDGMAWNDHLSIWGKDYEELKKNIYSRTEGIEEGLQDIKDLVDRLPQLAKEWEEAARTVERITSIKGMGYLSGEFKHLR